MRKITRRGFTLIELLVVIAIIAILAAILFPGLRQGAGSGPCDRLQEQPKALMMYTQDYDEVYPNRMLAQVNIYGDNDLSWRTLIQPYVKSTELMVCLSNPEKNLPSADPEFKISYVGNFTWGADTSPPDAFTSTGQGIFGQPNSSGVSLAAVPYPAETISVLEAYKMPWTALIIDVAFYRDKLWSGHSGMGNYLLADGHVKALRPSQTNNGKNFWYRDQGPLGNNGRACLVTTEATFR